MIPVGVRHPFQTTLILFDNPYFHDAIYFWAIIGKCHVDFEIVFSIATAAHSIHKKGGQIYLYQIDLFPFCLVLGLPGRRCSIRRPIIFLTSST